MSIYAAPLQKICSETGYRYFLRSEMYFSQPVFVVTSGTKVSQKFNRIIQKDVTDRTIVVTVFKNILLTLEETNNMLIKKCAYACHRL